MTARNPADDPARTAYTDQYAAAVAETTRTLAEFAEHGGIRPAVVLANRWLGGHAKRLKTALETGKAVLCPHIGPAPQMAHAAVWAPGHLVCSSCTRALDPAEDDDQRCDRCQRHTRRLYAGCAGYGPILLAFGLCPACVRATGLTLATTPARPGVRADG